MNIFDNDERKDYCFQLESNMLFCTLYIFYFPYPYLYSCYILFMRYVLLTLNLNPTPYSPWYALLCLYVVALQVGGVFCPPTFYVTVFFYLIYRHWSLVHNKQSLAL